MFLLRFRGFFAGEAANEDAVFGGSGAALGNMCSSHSARSFHVRMAGLSQECKAYNASHF
jgi:hypothetical protein